MLNPINRTRAPADVERYQVEPYVVAADVYTHPSHVGRGGWTWYTGSAAWMYRLGLESILGLRRRGSHFTVAPCIPGSWDGFRMHWRYGRTSYQITVENPGRRNRGVAEAILDGATVDAGAIPLVDDGAVHRLRVRMGDPAAEVLPEPEAEDVLSLGHSREPEAGSGVSPPPPTGRAR